MALTFHLFPIGNQCWLMRYGHQKLTLGLLGVIMNSFKTIEMALSQISHFNDAEDKKIKELTLEINRLSEHCRKRAEDYKETYGDECRTLPAINHVLEVINANIYLIDSRLERQRVLLSSTMNRVETLLNQTIALTKEVKGAIS